MCGIPKGDFGFATTCLKAGGKKELSAGGDEMRQSLLALAVSLGCALSVQAGVVPIFYTQLGSTDVLSSTYNTANFLGTALGIASSEQGADGILLGPNSTLFYGGEASNGVFQITQTGTDTTPYPAFGTGTSGSFFLAINQNNTVNVFTFNNLGSIAVLPVPSSGPSSGLITNGAVHAVTGADTNVSDLFWSSSNTAYYLTGAAGTTGDLGTINLSTFVTTQLFAGIATAQDAVFDPFTGLVVLFGDGEVDTFNPGTNTLGTAVTLPGATAGLTCGGGSTAQLDAGTVDGAGHAYVAGCGNLYYIDYSATGNILSASDVRQSVGVPNGIKDIVVNPAEATPEPPPLAMMLIGLGALTIGRWRRASKRV
jgi:hypothetical protein